VLKSVVSASYGEGQEREIAHFFCINFMSLFCHVAKNLPFHCATYLLNKIDVVNLRQNVVISLSPWLQKRELVRETVENPQMGTQFFAGTREKVELQEKALLVGAAGNYERLNVMRDLGVLFDSCYEFGVNPLARIRKCFSSFGWQYFDLNEGYRHTDKIAASVDFVWRIYWGGFVAASIKDKSTPTDIIRYLSPDATGVLVSTRDVFKMSCIWRR